MKTKLPTEWQELSDQLGFQEFTPIQTQLFEPLLAGENLLGVSQTGTGKTLAYL
ncbi:DEAD/DEAH box helicase, partial [Stenotrophomonas acidaminiphila]|nr:DEAD/DEAH box helicase [Stenotrophomonas acidaminiphila]